MAPASRIPKSGLAISLLVLLALVVFASLKAHQAGEFVRLVERARPAWLLLAVAFQLGTYLSAGTIWGRVAAAAGHPLRTPSLARLSVEKLSVDQFMPTGGLSGNLVLVRALSRQGLPGPVAAEAVLIDMFSHYGAFAAVSAVALVVLAVHHQVTPAIIGLLAPFTILIACIPLALAWLLKHRDYRPGPRLARFRLVTRTLETISRASVERIRNRRLLVTAVLLQTTIYILDSATLWAVLTALGAPVHPLTAFVALVIANMAGTVSFLPGGVGSFEAGCTATLALLGVPVAAALTGTLLLRGLTLWLPLLPGLLLARRDLSAPQGNGKVGKQVEPGLPLAQVMKELNASPTGLSANEARRRLETEGPNSIEVKGMGRFSEMLRSVSSPLALILLAAAVASVFVGQKVDAGIIAAMVVLSGGINYWQSSRSARAVEQLQSRVTPTATALRDGASVTVPRSELVTGDVVLLTAGDLVPADARLLESTDLHVQQASLTGESLPTEKSATDGPLEQSGPDAPQLVFVGTSIVSGTASAVVLATGRQTAFGDIAARLAARPEETEFERGLRRFGMLILKTVIFLVLFILVVSITMGRDAFQSLLFAVALAVGLTPEYLPMITTVTLAQGASRMAKQKVIVKHLASIQNLGSIDVLCSDKTGTLTSGIMTLNSSLDATGEPSQRTLLLGRINSSYETGVKSALDAAILETKGEALQGYRKVGEIPFDFERRRLSVLVQTDETVLMVTKGAPESVLASCRTIESNGQVRPMTDADRKRCLQLFRDLSAEGYRVLAVATREFADGDKIGREDETDLTMAGFLSFADQLLDGVEDAIAGLDKDGVELKILSGDNELVTRTICRKVGIENPQIMTGADIEQLHDTALARAAENTQVFARVSPAQKQRLVMALKRDGRVVGFMGDGINDAPSLHGADVGISVAGAVDVAQDASDILLLEKRLDVLHAGIVAGRRSFANVLKYLFMGTSSNFGNMLSMAGAVFFLPFLPMLPTQILVNNFLYDLAQITIPTDNVDPFYLRKPQRWNMGVIRKFMLLAGPISSVFDFLTFAVLLLVFKFGQSLFQTGWFVESLTTQVLVVFVIRTTGRPWTNRPSVALTTTVAAVVVAGIALPFSPLAGLLGMQPLPAKFFVLVALVVPTYLALVELAKGRILRGILPRAGH